MSVSEKQKDLLNCREKHDVEREGNEGETVGDTRSEV
jgi:hypothetical protein